MNKLAFRILVAAIAFCGIIALMVIPHKPRRAVIPRQEQQQPARVPAAPERPPQKMGTIAIVIDDVGYTRKNFAVLAGIELPLTLSVLPNLPYSQQAGELMHKRFEIILHLPMEPKSPTGLEKDTILAGMDAAAIRSIVAEDLGSLKYARGVSNHMGSKVTEDCPTLTLVFNELKQRGLFFLDSFVTPKSACASAARAAGIRWARREVFLDNRLDADYIRKQLAILKRKARTNGSAIGIGHDRGVTLEVLREEMPRMAAEGYTFVFVSDLLNQP